MWEFTGKSDVAGATRRSVVSLWSRFPVYPWIWIVFTIYKILFDSFVRIYIHIWYVLIDEGRPRTLRRWTGRLAIHNTFLLNHSCLKSLNHLSFNVCFTEQTNKHTHGHCGYLKLASLKRSTSVSALSHSRSLVDSNDSIDPISSLARGLIHPRFILDDDRH